MTLSGSDYQKTELTWILVFQSIKKTRHYMSKLPAMKTYFTLPVEEIWIRSYISLQKTRIGCLRWKSYSSSSRQQSVRRAGWGTLILDYTL